MIARIWSARATRDTAPAYAEYLRVHVFAGLRAIDGYETAMLLERESDGAVDIQVVTFWRSLDAIRAFAGADVETAVVTDQAAAMLLDYDRRVRHYRVTLRDRG